MFNYNLKTRKINNPVGYFITLAKTTAKEKAYRTDRWSDFAWLQQNAALQKMDVDVLAKQMRL